MSERRDPRLVLVLDGDPRPGAELPQSGMMTIGSSRERADFVVPGAGVADVHCAIGRAKGGGWAVKDLGSAQGTRVNGRAIESARVATGDTISIGERTLRVVDPAGESTRTPREGASDAARESSGVASRSARDPEDDDARRVDFATPVEARGADKNPSSARADKLPEIGGYRIEATLGRGGMGQVYLAVQERLARKVALKVLATRLEADVEFVRRFQAEARAAAALNHPNVVTVFDVGEDRGTHFLSMEYMDRGNLEERVARVGRLAWREVLDILHDAASGLVYAEARKIVHRDLKPANLMQNHTGVTKLADLGLATHVEVEESQAADKKVFGTPHFMSPEQARGERVDSRSDLYSLGATAYRLLTGHTPFEGASSREILRAHLRDEPRPMREFASDLPDGVVALVATLMRKDAAQRFQSAAELLSEVDRLRGVPAAARTPPPARSRRGVVAALALCLVAGIVAVAWLRSRAKPATNDMPAASAHSVPRDASAPDATEAQSTAAGPDGAPRPGPAKPNDDDKALQLFEANARVAFLELSQREMEPVAKRDELRALAAKFSGTSAATDALERADAIDADIQRDAHEAGERNSARDAVVAALRTAAALDAAPPRPGQSFEQMNAVTGQQAYAQDPEFLSAKKSIELAVIQRSCAYARDVLADTQHDMEATKFEDVQRKLTELLPLFDLPDFAPGQGPAGIEPLYEMGRTARERLKNLELLRGRYTAKQSQDDAREIASGFGGPDGLEREIRTLDLAAAQSRLERLSGKVASSAAQSFVKDLATDAERGEAMLAAVGREYATGGWRRKAVSDPRDKRNPVRTAVGADAQGVAVEGEGGAVDRVPWSAFGGNTKELSRLFWERLNREYTPDEARAIVALLRMTAVVEALERASKMLDPARRANFTEANARDVGECFAPLQQWIQKLGSEALCAREAKAATLLAQVLAQTTDGAWSVAVAGTERLLDEYQDTLLVRLLSDGSVPEPSRAAKPAAEPPK
jgi:pSer/pThr/pTyr-binding forkhead associated (FHA) protein/tRNA A-37 threonylcarbamoyl transferase component Bud32